VLLALVGGLVIWLLLEQKKTTTPANPKAPETSSAGDTPSTGDPDFSIGNILNPSRGLPTNPRDAFCMKYPSLCI